MRAKPKCFYARTPQRPAPAHPATGHTFLIVVEGAATEPAYFKDLPLSDLLSRVATAMKHAAKCHAHWDAVEGDRNPSTHVAKLLSALNDSARAEVRLS
jgi:hypothetical protein